MTKPIMKEFLIDPLTTNSAIYCDSLILKMAFLAYLEQLVKWVWLDRCHSNWSSPQSQKQSKSCFRYLTWLSQRAKRNKCCYNYVQLQVRDTICYRKKDPFQSILITYFLKRRRHLVQSMKIYSKDILKLYHCFSTENIT